MADPILLEQVLTNLLRNGIEAMRRTLRAGRPELIVTQTRRMKGS